MDSDRKNFRHGHSQGKGQAASPTYLSWTAMKRRCLNPKAAGYERYGGAGVTVCERWLDFVNFLEDMGVRPEGMTLDRIDRRRGYEPGNCRWATHSEQQLNRGKFSDEARARMSEAAKVSTLARERGARGRFM